MSAASVRSALNTSGKMGVIAGVLFFATVQRLHAPIQEIPESPTPKPERSATHTPKQTTKPESTKRDTGRSTIRNSTPFAGTWSGTMNISLFGNIGYTFQVDPAQTTEKMWGTNEPSQIPHTKVDVCSASVSPEGISWNWSAWKWTLKPYPDGKTAFVKVVGPFQNGSSVFERRNNPP